MDLKACWHQNTKTKKQWSKLSKLNIFKRMWSNSIAGLAGLRPESFDDPTDVSMIQWSKKASSSANRGNRGNRKSRKAQKQFASAQVQKVDAEPSTSEERKSLRPKVLFFKTYLIACVSQVRAKRKRSAEDNEVAKQSAQPFKHKPSQRYYSNHQKIRQVNVQGSAPSLLAAWKTWNQCRRSCASKSPLPC